MSPKTEEMISLLREAAQAWNRRKGRESKVVYLFCPQYVLAELLGVDPSTIRRWFYRYPELKRQVNCAYHCAEVDGRRMKDGMIWAVALEEQPGALRIPPESFGENLRDFVADMKRGRTLHGPYPTRQDSPVETLLSWTANEELPPLEDSPCNSREAVYPAVDNPGAIPLGARWIVDQLGDSGRERHWMKVLWQVNRGELSPSFLVDQLERVFADVREGFARSGPRLLTSRVI